MGAHDSPWFLACVLAALGICFLQTAESEVPLSNPSINLPNLLTGLRQIPDYSMFRSYIIKYQLSKEIQASDGYTIFAPNNDAIKKYIQEKGDSSLDENVIKYHIILGEQLFKEDFHIGMHRETLLGISYKVAFFVHNGKLYLNNAPINNITLETNKGVIHGLAKVLEIQKNRCDINETSITEGTCVPRHDCEYYDGCPYGTKAILHTHAVCFRYGDFRRFGCRLQCLRSSIIRNCCLGFFGYECLACPGMSGKPCMGHGVCLDGISGKGKCQCEKGFNGTACEMCKGKYGIRCNQDCTCVHGKCNDGTEGDGSCECDIGWRGVHCDTEIKDDKCNKLCHTTANCLENADGTAYCKCSTGFKGDGKICTAVNACETKNGGCSIFARCIRTSPGNRLCLCNDGYNGDGVFCQEINPCEMDNGGCHENAECTQTGANQSVCNCLKGYSGDGKSCVSINPCEMNNGGCDRKATCNHTGPGERGCTCMSTYVGDGVICRGTISQELRQNSNATAFFHSLELTDVREIDTVGPFTVFVPLSNARNSEYWRTLWPNNAELSQILRFHIVACNQLTFKDLATMANVTSLQGNPISIAYSPSQNSIILNNNATITSSDIVTSNGIIHYIDNMLFPPNTARMQRWMHFEENVTIIAETNGFSIFMKLLEETDLVSSISNPFYFPVTLFWPSDKIIKAMPQQQQDFLFSQENRRKLIDILKFHIVPESKVFANDLPKRSPMRTLHGNNITVKCGGKGNIGDLFINDGPCKIVERRMQFNFGVAYGIDCLLNPTNVDGHCDSVVTLELWGECDSCFSGIGHCPRGFKSKGMRKDCAPYYNRWDRSCKELCGMVTWTPDCCRGYFGRDCQECPGGSDDPCGGHGQCEDGLSGTGVCGCNSGFTGTSCEHCAPGKYGPECKSCECSVHGQCDDGVTGSGQCTCDSGWAGIYCETTLDEMPVCTPNCSSNAVCQEKNRCVCQRFYEGDGVTCTVMDLCRRNNGGCAKPSTCSQSGVKVTCSCQNGFKGDGYVCIPIDVCVDRPNGGCHEHAICTMTGPGENKCDCKDNYIGDGKDCQLMAETVNRCSQDNGDCHANAICTDLHYQDTTVGVFHLRSPKGQYNFTYEEARVACAKEDAELATYSQLSYAQKAGYHLCLASWLNDARVAYPTVYSSPDCYSAIAGIVDYGIKANLSETWDAFCYRVQDVKCACKEGYIGNGYVCNGNLLQVLTSSPMFSRFSSEILRYFNKSAEGQEFVTYLTNKSIQATMFVPNNDAIGKNETLSGQDIEYHLSNGSAIFYENFINTSTLQTRIGRPLHVTYDTSGNALVKKCTNLTCLVEGRNILQWNIYATNGIIHVISRPLRVPPVQLSQRYPVLAAGISVVILAVVGLLIFAVCTYRKSGKGFLHFRKLRPNKNMDVLMLDNPSKPTHRLKSATASITSPSDPTYNVLLDLEDQELVGDEPQD